MGTSDDGVPTAGRRYQPHRDGATNVLLLAPDGTQTDADACNDLLLDTDAESRNVLRLDYSPPDRDARAVGRADGPPGDTTFVCIGEQTRSAASAPSTADPVAGTATVQVVPDPTDLARVGVIVNECLEEWADTRTAVCYHSLTDLLDHVDLQTAFRFLHVLTGRIATADAMAHFHLDPSVHGDPTVGTLSMLFDEVVEVEDGPS